MMRAVSSRPRGHWESGRLIGNAIEAAPIAFVVLDSSGRYRAANRAACRLSGYSRSELLRLTTTDLSGDPGVTRAAFEAAFSTGSGFGVRKLRRKDGRVVPVEYRLARGGLGGEELLVSAWWPQEPEADFEADDAEPESASISREQERVLGVAFQNAPIAVVVADGASSYLAVNDRACEIAKYSREQLYELGAWGIVESSRELEGTDMTSLPGIRRGVAEIRCGDGTLRPVGFRVATSTLGRHKVRIAVWWELDE
jgi:PAS domain S-box-containing protein